MGLLSAQYHGKNRDKLQHVQHIAPSLPVRLLLQGDDTYTEKVE